MKFGEVWLPVALTPWASVRSKTPFLSLRRGEEMLGDAYLIKSKRLLSSSNPTSMMYIDTLIWIMMVLVAFDAIYPILPHPMSSLSP